MRQSAFSTPLAALTLSSMSIASSCCDAEVHRRRSTAVRADARQSGPQTDKKPEKQNCAKPSIQMSEASERADRSAA